MLRCAHPCAHGSATAGRCHHYRSYAYHWGVNLGVTLNAAVNYARLPWLTFIDRFFRCTCGRAISSQHSSQMENAVHIMTGWREKHANTKTGKAKKREEQMATVNDMIEAGGMDLMNAVHMQIERWVQSGLRWADVHKSQEDQFNTQFDTGD